MFLYRRAWQVESCLFNLLNTRHAADYNAFLSWVGRGITVLERKLQIVTGFAAPDFEADPDEHGNIPTRIKDDAAYLYVRYERSPSCAFRPPWKAENGYLVAFGAEAPKGATVHMVSEEEIDGAIDDHIVIPARPPKAPKKKAIDKVVAGAKTAIATAVLNQLGVDVTGVPEWMIKTAGGNIDAITAVQRQGRMVKGISMGARKKPEPVADMVKKRVAKAKTIDEKIDVAARAAVATVQEKANQEAMDNLRETAMKAAGKAAKGIVTRMKELPDGTKHMAAFLLAEHERDPKKAEAIFKKIMTERPEVATDVPTLLQKLRLAAIGPREAKKKAAGKAPVAKKKE